MELITFPIPDSKLAIPIKRWANKGLLDINNGGWVAGGYAMRLLFGMEWTAESDIDIFFRSYGQSQPANVEIFNEYSLSIGSHYMVDKFIDTFPRSNKKIETSDGILFEEPGAGQKRYVQLIKNSFYPSVTDLLINIDFTICRVATDGKVIVCDSRAIDDFHDKILRNAVEKTSVNTFKRIAKYITYGFFPAPGLLKWATNLDSQKTTITNNMKIIGNWDAY